MTTRHVSAENAYPFVTDEQLPAAAQGIVDLWFVVYGAAVGEISGSDGSSAVPVINIQTRLEQVIAGATTTQYRFIIEQYEKMWAVQFTVPHTGTGIVQNDASDSVRAVLTYNANNVLKTGTEWPHIRVEPSRTVFYHEAVQTLSFENISRCDGVETQNTLKVVELGGGLANLSLGDGHNVEISNREGVLTFAASQGNGLGTAPSLEFGNTEDCIQESSSSGVPEEDDVSLVRVVNGISPSDGNLVVSTSRLIGKEKEQGRLTLVLRRA